MIDLTTLVAALLIALVLGFLVYLSGQLTGRARDTENVVRNLDQELRDRQAEGQQRLLAQLAQAKEEQQGALHQLDHNLTAQFGELRHGLEQRHAESVETPQATLQGRVDRVQEQVANALQRSSEELGRRMESLTESTDSKLREISGQVDRRLSEGFEKTTATFADVVKRLALIDEAQKKITELSTNVVGLQEVLADRSARGTFGEVQLNALVRNVLPESSFKLQETLSNGNRVDCLLLLPGPTGNVSIDSKFPLENYRRKTSTEFPAEDRKAAEAAFSKDVRKHIDNIAEKYIHPPETSDGAVMFIPAEAVFAEIHAGHPDLVEEAYNKHVWMASPTTLMAVLTTARAVIKDAATREQVHIIRDHLARLGQDFGRFQKRMDNLKRHIDQAQEDVGEVHTSAQKITTRFGRIERLDLNEGDVLPLLDDGPEGTRPPASEPPPAQEL